MSDHHKRGMCAYRIATAIGISRKCLNIINTNIFVTLAVKFGFLGLAVVGVVDMWFAILADVGVMIAAVLNSARALRYNSGDEKVGSSGFMQDSAPAE